MCHLYWTFCHCCKKQIGQWKKSNICQGKDFHEVYCGEINVKKIDRCQECMLFCEGKTKPCYKYNKKIPYYYSRYQLNESNTVAKYLYPNCECFH